MRLADRLTGGSIPPAQRTVAADGARSQLHEKLLETLDREALAALPPAERPAVLRARLEALARSEQLALNRGERSALIGELLDEMLGLGPLEPLVADPEVQDILVNGAERVFVERNGMLHETAVHFRDDDHLMQVIDRIVAAVGRRIDEASPMVDARLPDGSRVNVIIPPLSLAGPVLSIRRFGRTPLALADLLANQTLVPEMQAYLRAAVGGKLNLLISGGTGSGKTTLLNGLSEYVPEDERVITIEDSAELRLRQPHVVSLEARPPNVEGRGEVTLTELVKNSLRMRPDRIIVGEARGAEVMDMLQAMNTGHPGSMSTVHANSPRDALWRLEVMASMGTTTFSDRTLRGLIASAIDVVVQVARLPDGRRRVVSIGELDGIEQAGPVVRELFVFERTGVGDGGRVQGRVRATGAASHFLSHLAAQGFELGSDVFEFERELS